MSCSSSSGASLKFRSPWKGSGRSIRLPKRERGCRVSGNCSPLSTPSDARLSAAKAGAPVVLTRKRREGSASPRVCTLAPVSTHSSLSAVRSEEHTSELQSRPHLVCRLLLEKKKKQTTKKNSQK